jgi:hypothetical protein
METLRSRQGRAEAVLVAYDTMEADGQDVRPEPLEERRKRLAKLLSRKTKVMPDGTQVSEAITGLERVVPDDGRGRSRPRCHRSTDPRRASGSTTHRRR